MIGFVLPTYNKFVYARVAAASFFEHTPDGVVILVDDGSPLFRSQDWDLWQSDMPGDRLHILRFEENAGLTRGWNVGLDAGRVLGCDYLIAGNSDVVFTPGWSVAMLGCLNAGWDLVGPVTNCPGKTNQDRQHVRNFFPGYRVSDKRASLQAVAEHLARTQPSDRAVPDRINGFFQMAKTATWIAGKFDSDHYYNPANRMVKNEDELQERWLRAGRKIGFVPGSFILHYRAVTRGDKHKHGDWLRMT